ncbi:MAG: beta-ketoacyl-ACP synthase III [Acidimicrobiales bacterium]
MTVLPHDGVAITGIGTALPERRMLNKEFEARLDTSDEWIRQRTGIRERRVGGVTADLATDALRLAIADAGIAPEQIDSVIIATSTPSHQIPATAATVQQRLGLHCGGFDLNAACAGFVYGLISGYQLVAGGASHVAVVGVDTLTRMTDPDDRGTAFLFGDGAAAVILSASAAGPGLLSWDTGTDPDTLDALYAHHNDFLKMDGQEVFRRAVRAVVASCTKALEVAGLTADDVALFVPHQANVRIIDAVGKRLGIPLSRCAVVIEDTANTSAASIPLALAAAVGEGRVAAGDVVMMCGFGAGLTWATAVVRWGA